MCRGGCACPADAGLGGGADRGHDGQEQGAGSERAALQRGRRPPGLRVRGRGDRDRRAVGGERGHVPAGVHADQHAAEAGARRASAHGERPHRQK
eukprot:174822-Rhodomonas_salina.1